MIFRIGLAVLLVGLGEARLIIQITQAVLHKYIPIKDINTQKSHGINLIGNKYFFEKVFI